jgi:hypothetical protein
MKMIIVLNWLYFLLPSSIAAGREKCATLGFQRIAIQYSLNTVFSIPLILGKERKIFVFSIQKKEMPSCPIHGCIK